MLWHFCTFDTRGEADFFRSDVTEVKLKVSIVCAEEEWWREKSDSEGNLVPRKWCGPHLQYHHTAPHE
jgi:hypothetical protein